MRLIDAEKLAEVLNRYLAAPHVKLRNNDISVGLRMGINTCLTFLNNANTIEAEPVKRAEWIEDGYRGLPCVCSYCGEEAHYTSKFKETFGYDWEENLKPTGFEEIREYIKTDYCPACGAKMYGDRKEGSDNGKTVFLTSDETEAAIEKMKEENNGEKDT